MHIIIVDLILTIKNITCLILRKTLTTTATGPKFEMTLKQNKYQVVKNLFQKK